MRSTLLALFVLAAASCAFAIEDTPENRTREARRYLAATPPRELFNDVAEQMVKSAPAGKQELVRNAFTKHLDIDALTVAMQDAMVKTFTADELSALADFYGSPVGKAAMKKFGIYMAAVMPSLQAEMMKMQAKIQQELAAQPAQPK